MKRIIVSVNLNEKNKQTQQQWRLAKSQQRDATPPELAF